MTLEEYARKHPVTDTELKISKLEAQIWEDGRNDPAWMRRQNKEHNAKIFSEIEKLRSTIPSDH